GDSPIIGAGTYANNKTCAISSTGQGEYFIKNVVAYDIAALMEYRKLSIAAAAEEVINVKLKSQNAKGGVIGIDNNGKIIMCFNTDGMFRGYRKNGENPVVELYK
ncbi:MAG: isoaspartyl peptidase/L-asparaginase, partial [Ignavibacteriales bacterium]|nr:isoaspartyl peptidase/L-asparaginase [Ignavibacteriales bacterium]